MTTKEIVEKLAKNIGVTLSKMGEMIGRGGGSSLARTLRDDSLKVKDLKKCLECDGGKLIVKYKGKNIEID